MFLCQSSDVRFFAQDQQNVIDAAWDSRDEIQQDVHDRTPFQGKIDGTKDPTEYNMMHDVFQTQRGTGTTRAVQDMVKVDGKGKVGGYHAMHWQGHGLFGSQEGGETIWHRINRYSEVDQRVQREPPGVLISKKKAQGQRRQGDAGQRQKASEQVASGINAIEKTQPSKQHNRKNSLSEMFEHVYTHESLVHTIDTIDTLPVPQY